MMQQSQFFLYAHIKEKNKYYLLVGTTADTFATKKTPLERIENCFQTLAKV